MGFCNLCCLTPKHGHSTTRVLRGDDFLASPDDSYFLPKELYKNISYLPFSYGCRTDRNIINAALGSVVS
jgi:hypothetical protein